MTNHGINKTNPTTIPFAGASSGSRTTPEPDHIPQWSRAKLAEIPFERHAINGTTCWAMKMPGGKWVAKWHFEEVWHFFWRNLDALSDVRKYTAKALCGDPSWEDRPLGAQIAMGRCMKYFAKHRVLPILLTNEGKSGPRKYRVTGSTPGDHLH